MPTTFPSKGLLSINRLSLYDAARAYISMGWPVLPLKRRDKPPIIEGGLLNASDDRDQINAWWSKYPQANIGIRTGIVFDVLDLDGPDAIRSLNEIAPGYKHHGPIQSTGKGYHLLFEPTGARNSAKKLPGIDFRGQNGYIVVAPSVHPNGHAYRWARDEEIPAGPEWLTTLVTPPKPEAYEPRDPILAASAAELDIVDQFRQLSFLKLEEVGNKYRTHCFLPEHEDSTPSLWIYPETNSFFCFGCNEYGDTLNMARYLSGRGLRDERPEPALGALPNRENTNDGSGSD